MLDDSELQPLTDIIGRTLQAYPETLGVLQGRTVDAVSLDKAFALAAEQGWLGIAFPETLGGLDLGMKGATLLAEEVGRALLPGPFAVNVALLPALAAVAPEIAALAEKVLEAGGRAALAVPVSSADGDIRWLADNAPGSSDLLAVETSGEDRLWVRWLAMPALKPLDPFDPTCPVAECSPAALESKLLAEIRLTGADANDVLGPIHLWIAAELVGIAKRASELSIAQAGERQQFGKPIGSHQGIKHRIVDDYVRRENAAAIVARAAQAWDAGEKDSFLLAQTARAAASEAALSTTGHCIQVHGGTGFSWEHPAHLYYKRARRLVSVLGSAEASRATVGRIICGLDP